MSWKNSYYVNNDYVLDLLKSIKSSPNKDKKNIKNQLINNLLYLVYTRVKGYKDQDYYDDVFQEGVIGLYQAFDKFDERKSPNFFIVAKWYINTNVREFLRKQSRKIEIPNNCDSFLEEETIDLKYEKLQDYKHLCNAINNLPEIDKNVINMRFGFDGGEPKTLQQIGDVFSLSKRRIEQIQVKAIHKLKQECGGANV